MKVEKKRRGRYKAYILNSSLEIPVSTRNDHRHAQVFNQEASTSFHYPSNASTIITHFNQTDESVPTQAQNSEEIHQTNDSVDSIENLSDTENAEDDPSDSLADELSSFVSNDEITREELAAAYLAAFFNGKTTQSSIKDFLQLSNITSNIKLPTTFDGLVKLLIKEQLNFIELKSWFCGTCLKKIPKLKDRFQRECDICKSK